MHLHGFFFEEQRFLLLGDIRRLCKHLKYLVEKKINVDLLHPLCKWILITGASPGKNFHKLDVDQFKYSVFVAFDNKNEWWHIYMIDAKNEILHYSYHLTEKRFSYDEKPKGSVTVIKNHILELKKYLDYIEFTELSKQERQHSKERAKGCFIATLVFIIVIYIIIKIFS